MKKVFLCLLAVIVLFTGCTGATTPTDVSSVVTAPQEVSSVVSKPILGAQSIDLPANEYWTWNQLYDYLENPRKSGDMAFDEEQGESISLLDVDGTTSLSDQWNIYLQQDMVVVKYNQAGEIIGKYQINLIGGVSSTVKPPVVSSAPEQNTSSTAQPQKTVVSFYTVRGDTALEKAVEAFNKQSKTVEILPIPVSQTMTAQQLAQLQKENNGPDLVLMNHKELVSAASQKQLANLSTLSKEKWSKILEPSFLRKTTLENKLYGLPLGGSTYCLACNDELLYRAGAQVPQTFDQLIENAKQLRDRLSGVTPIGLSTDIADAPSMAREFTMLLTGFGGTLFTPDYQSAAFYSKSGVDVLSLYQTLYQEKLIADYVEQKDVYNQRIGYGIVSSVDYEKTFGKKAKTNFTAAPLLAPGNGEAVSYLDLYSFCIPAAATKKAKQGALEFLSFFYENAQYSVSLCQKKGWVPALTQAMENKAYQTDAWQVFIQAAQNAVTQPPIDCYSTIESYLAECISTVISGGDKELALEKAWKKTENRLARG